MKTCLVVDDSKVIRKVARHILERCILRLMRLVTVPKRLPIAIVRFPT